MQNDIHLPEQRFNLLNIPVLGPLLKTRYGRLMLQVPLFAAAILLIIDGFSGPQIAPRNLATVAPWVHYRGFVVLILLLAGNLFCMGCPFTVPRTLARRFSVSGLRFPTFLRNKWLAIGGLFLMFYLYEAFDLWASPALTAWVIVAYFAGSFVLELLFAESPFCKYVCPLGSFNFTYSTAAPAQITVANTDTCRTCVGKECVNGSYRPQKIVVIDEVNANGVPVRQHTNGPRGVLGCGTELFPPTMTTNMDCIYCLDCARACPHDNVALSLRTPGRELLEQDSWRGRWDLALMVIALSFMGITNAFGMVPPVYHVLAWTADTLGLSASSLSDAAIEGLVLLPLMLLANVVLPVGLTLLVATISRVLGGIEDREDLRQTVTAFAPAFVPVGLGIWTAHYGFHLLVAPLSIIPVVQEFFGAAGNWQLAQVSVPTPAIGIFQTVVMIGGFVWSLYIAFTRSSERYEESGFIVMIPWALFLFGLMWAANQIFAMPMEMRGSILFS